MSKPWLSWFLKELTNDAILSIWPSDHKTLEGVVGTVNIKLLKLADNWTSA